MNAYRIPGDGLSLAPRPQPTESLAARDLRAMLDNPLSYLSQMDRAALEVAVSSLEASAHV